MTSQALKIGDRIEVTTERLAYGGDAVARHDGLTIFIPLAAPGEQLKVRIVERKKNYARAIIESIVDPSAARRAPLCAYYGECGGCQLQHMNYAAQLEAKAGFIRDALTRIGKIEWPQEISVLHAAEVGYRTRAQIKIETARPLSGQTQRIGFNRLASNAVCDVASCPVLVPELDAGLARLRGLASEPAKAADAALSRLHEIDMAAGDSGIAFAPMINGLPSEPIARTIHNLTYSFSPATFFQSNALLLATLISEALDEFAGSLAIDLYAGVGLFTLQLARRFNRVIGIESDREAAQFVRYNLAANQLTNVELEQARVEQWLASLRLQRSDESEPIDLLLLDPPRAGAAEALNDIAALKPLRIVYVSCDPTTLARDLRRLLDAGYSLDRLTGIDLFPQTYHIETVAHLTIQNGVRNKIP